MSMEKTPVTILQEIMVKTGKTPFYELLHDEHEDNSKTFKFKVVCDGVIAFGIGRSKKDAKQEAALAMINKLNSQKVLLTSSNGTDYVPAKVSKLSNTSKDSVEIVSFDNSIVELQKVCIRFNLEKPSFENLDSTGPSHSLIFVVSCSVASFKVTGSGRSKKQAKQNAAKNMIKEINNLYYPQETSVKNIENRKMDQFMDNLEETKSDLLHNVAKIKINYDLKMDSKPKILEKNLQNDTLVTKLQNLCVFIKNCEQHQIKSDIIDVKIEFQNLLASANIEFHHMLLQTMDPVTFMLIIQLNTTPDILEMSLGSTREEAELRTINKIIQTLINTY